MTHKYKIELSYKATMVVNVEGDFHDEGEALEKANEICEDADINEFNIGEQLESRILNVE